MDYTVSVECKLPSEGKVYNTEINPIVKLRSMTTAEEMKRLNHSDRAYKAMSEIIDDCMVENIGISAYDMCVADYQYLLHKLRIVTYGENYKITTTCPFCGVTNKQTLNLDKLNLLPFDMDEFKKYSEFDLPATKQHIQLRLQTPRMIDDIAIESKETRNKNPEMQGDPAFLLTLKSLIYKVDGVIPEEFRVIPMIQKLPMMDTNYILKSAQRLNKFFGIDEEISNTCKICGLAYTSNFRTTSEFFGPSID